VEEDFFLGGRWEHEDGFGLSFNFALGLGGVSGMSRSGLIVLAPIPVPVLAPLKPRPAPMLGGAKGSWRLRKSSASGEGIGVEGCK
jgi:hypothetical protein